jgi:hypothetical protein
MPSSPSSRFIRVWALASTALCVVLVGYIVASHWSSVASDDGPAAAAPLAIAPIPQAWRDLPSEWMSQTTEPDHTGHVVLLDLAANREVIVERCRHRGYFDRLRGQPREADWSFCEPIVRGHIESVDRDGFALRRTDGRVAHVGISVERGSTVPRLILAFEGVRLALAPGTKNELYQQMESSPDIREEREALLEFSTSARTEANSATIPSPQ